MDSSPGEAAFSPSLTENDANDARPSSKHATNPKKMKAIGFEVEEMMKLFLVIIIGLVVVIIIIGASGGIKQLLDDFCARNPTICGQTSTQGDRNMARASFDALVIAQNCILNPAGCSCIQQPCIKSAESYTEQKASSIIPSTTSNAIGNGISGFQIKPTPSKEVTVSCAETAQATTQTELLFTIHMPDKASAETECKLACDPNSNGCKLTENGDHFDYNTVRKQDTMLQCTCSKNGVESTVYGYDRLQAQRLCASGGSSQDISLYNCQEVYVTDANRNIYDSLFAEPGQMVSRRVLYSDMYMYKCTFYRSGQKSESYYIYGIGANSEAQARKVCEKDILNSQATKSPLDSNYDISPAGSLKTDLLFLGVVSSTATRKNPLDGYDCKQTTATKSFSCAVKNFNLPDNFVGLEGAKKEYIEGMGDPNFLVYFQNFPVGEDELWAGFSAHYQGTGAIMFLTMCAADFLRPPGKFILKKTIAKPLSTVLAKAKSIIPKSIRTVERKLPEGMVTDINWYLKENRVSTFTAAKEWVLTQIDKLPQSVKTSIHTGLYAGINTEAAYLAGFADSKMGKFVYNNSQSLVLQIPLIKGEATRLADNKISDAEMGIQAGMPIVLNKGSIFKTNTPFYLASPCHADLTVKSSETVCASYSYSLSGEDKDKVQCDVIQPLLAGNLPNCALIGSASSFAGSDLEIYKAIKNLLKSRNTKLFEFSGDSLQKAYIPLLGDYNTYFADFQKISDTKYTVNLYANGIKVTDPPLEMTCINISQANPYTIGAIVSRDLSGKLKANAEENADLCYFHLSQNQKIKDSLKLNQVYLNIFFIKYGDYFYSEMLSPDYLYSTAKAQIIVLRGDADGNRYSITWDMTMYVGPDIPISPESGYFFTFENSNSDGTIDYIQSFTCKMPAVEVSANAASYTDKYNFCYSNKPAWVGAAMTTMSFALDAYVKRNPLTFAAGAALDCGLAIWELATTNSWPKYGIK